MTSIKLESNNIEQLSSRLALAMWNRHIVKCQTLYATKMTKVDSANVYERLRTIDVFDYKAINISPIVLQQYLQHFSIVDHLLCRRPETMDSYMLSTHCPYSVLQSMYDITTKALSTIHGQYDRLFVDIYRDLNLQ